MSSATQVNLSALVRETQAELQDPDPGVIAGEVLRRLDPSEYEGVLAQILRLFVRDVQSTQRSDLRAGIQVRKQQRAKSSHSPKLDRLKQLLATSIYTGVTHKPLGQCTADDLTNAADQLRELAARNLAAAQQYEEWAALVLSAHVVDFGSLPETTLHQALGWS